MMKPFSNILNAVAGPSKLPSRSAAGISSGIFLQRRPIVAPLPRSISTRTRSERPHSAEAGAIYSPERLARSRGVESSIRNTSRLHRSARYFTSASSSSAPIPPSSPSSYHPLLAAAPIAASISSDSVDPTASTSVLDPLIALLLSSPLPAGLTILLLTFTFRSAVTLPATIWQRRRMRRTKEIVRPAMKAINEQLAGVVAKECRAKGIDYEGYKKELKSQLAVHQSALHKKHSTHPLPTMLLPLFVHVPLIITLSLSIRRAIEAPMSPWAAESWWWLEHLGEVDPTMILPIMGGVIGMMNAEVIGRRNKDLGEGSAVKVSVDTAEDGRVTDASSAPLGPSPGAGVRPAAQTPTSARNRSSAPRTPPLPSHLAKPSIPSPTSPRLISTTSYPQTSSPTRPNGKARPATPSPRPATPTLRRVPVGTRKPTSPQAHLQPIQAAAEQSKELDKSRLTSKLFTYAMRCGAVLFIPIAAQVPAALALYWTGSMVFTLVQNLTLDWLDAKEKRGLQAGLDAAGTGEPK